MKPLDLYEIDRNYIDYIGKYENKLFKNSIDSQPNQRKYVGVILEIKNVKYFAPLTSFKPKHRYMKENIDFMKIGKKAVININNMFPVPKHLYKRIIISKITDAKYRELLSYEYLYIKKNTELIISNAAEVYEHKLCNGNNTPLARRCNNFILLEEVSKKYKKG